jgi:hypothetical protein
MIFDDKRCNFDRIKRQKQYNTYCLADKKISSSIHKLSPANSHAMFPGAPNAISFNLASMQDTMTNTKDKRRRLTPCL